MPTDVSAAPNNANTLDSPRRSPLRRGLEEALRDVSHGLSVAISHPLAGLIGLAGILVAVFLPPEGLGPSTCGMQRVAGLPCPSCGLTRSVTSIFHGEWLAAWQYNPFGYGVSAIFVLLTVLLFLPKSKKRLLANPGSLIARLGTAVFFIGLLSMLAFGLLRGILIEGGFSDYRWWKTTNVAPALEHRPDVANYGSLWELPDQKEKESE